MSRGSRFPRSQTDRARRARTTGPGQGSGGGWIALAPAAGLCLMALIGGVVAFSGRGGTETRASAACLTDSAPGRFANWDAFFRRYPFDDAFVKARIREANGDAPPGVVVVPLERGAACGRPRD